MTSELMAGPGGPATYPAVMDLTRGEAGRRPATGHHLPTGPYRLSSRRPSTGT